LLKNVLIKNRKCELNKSNIEWNANKGKDN
jgi:hypothetical protein